MLERGLKREALWAYWVVACVGPAVVLRFLLEATAAARLATTGHLPSWFLSRWGISVCVLGAVAIISVIMLAGLDWSPPGRLLRDLLWNRPALPALGTFVLASATTGLLSVYFAGRSYTFPVPPWIVTASQWLSISAVGLFALACGCVIGPRVPESAKLRIWWRLRSEGRKRRDERREVFMAGAVAVRYRYLNSIFMVFLPDRGNEADAGAVTVLRGAVDLLDQYNDNKLPDLDVSAEWAVLKDRWRRLVKISIHLIEPVNAEASVVLRVLGSDWSYIQEGCKLALTTKRHFRDAERFGWENGSRGYISLGQIGRAVPEADGPPSAPIEEIVEGSHLINDEETRRIASQFLNASPWVAKINWAEVGVTGNETLANSSTARMDLTEPDCSQRGPWSVTFTDPFGQQQRLTHELVLASIRALVFGDTHDADEFSISQVREWLTKPARERRELEVGPEVSSQICERALYDA